MTRGAGIAAALAVAACGGKTDDRFRVAIPDEHVAAVNALVPPAWQGKLVFEAGAIVDRRGREVATYRLARPRDWVPAFMQGSIKPADADDFGRSPSLGANLQLRVGTNCDGECRSDKDWPEIADRVYYRAFTTGQRPGKVVKDERRATGRTLVFVRDEATSGERGVNLLTTWWKQGGSQMFLCEVRLDEQFAAPPPASLETLVPAFEKACSLVSAE